MKKLPIYILLALIGAFSVFSCVQPLDPNVKQGSGAYNLDLSVSCLAPATKADEGYPNGVDSLNENKIDWVDWFIFRDTTAGNDQPWQSGRDTIRKTDGTSEFSVKTLDMQDYMGEQTSASGYVFTVANYPGQHSELSGTFHNILKVSYLTAELKSKLGINDRTKKFEELSNFVMTSTVESFTLNENAPSATVNAKLSRQMAKISLNIHIAPYIDEMLAYTSGLDTNSVSYIQTWYPDVKNIRAYLTYANMEGTLTPVTTQTDRESVAEYVEEKFFTYNSYGFKPEITYRNNDTKDTAYVVGTPFYSYPMRWETSDAHAPFIKIILAWKPVDESKISGHVTPNERHNFVNHTTGGVNQGTMDVVNAHSFPSDVATGNQKFYYKITLPGENNFLRSNVWTKISLDVALLGGKEEETSVEVAGRYYVVNWSDPGVTAGGDLTAGTYLSLATARDTFYIYGGNSIEIPVLSSHNLEVVNTTATYYDYSSANPAQRTLSGDNYTIQANGRSSVTLTHELISDLNQVSAQDISTITYTFRIRHIGSSGLYKDLTVIQYPSLYIETLTPGNAFLDGRGQGTGSAYTTYGYLNYDNAATTIYHVHITAFNGDSRYYTPKRQNVSPDETYEYLITDPRVNAGWGSGDLIAYGPANGTKTNWPSEVVTNMKVATSTPNFIAPSFLVSSRYGRPGDSSSQLTSLEIAKKRCATYQEAGYPAGRWRLPTEAEVYFLFTLQTHNLITKLYTTGSGTYGYWASSGYVFGRYWTTGTPDFRTIGSNDPASVRCVYDTWYWGDKPVTPIDVYHPGPTN